MVAVLAPHTTPTAAPSRPALRLVPAAAGAGRTATRSQSVAVAPRVRPSAATYWRRRFVALLMVTTLVLAAHATRSSVGGSPEDLSVATGPVASASASAVEPAGPAPAGGEVYVVRPGDTMWSIASSLEPDGDVRSLVDELTARAGGASLQAGQRIAIDGLRR